MFAFVVLTILIWTALRAGSATNASQLSGPPVVEEPSPQPAASAAALHARNDRNEREERRRSDVIVRPYHRHANVALMSSCARGSPNRYCCIWFIAYASPIFASGSANARLPPHPEWPNAAG